MIQASTSSQRPADARLYVFESSGNGRVLLRSRFAELLRPRDLVVANDAATLPASLGGIHRRTGRTIEVRLAARARLDPSDARSFRAVLFGEGDFRTTTEERPNPPELLLGDVLELGPLMARVVARGPHPRLVMLHFMGALRSVWEGLARHGRPIQYAYVKDALHVWDSWTPIAGPPVAMEPPSAGFAIDWAMVHAIRASGAGFTTLTHAAGLSSTGDPRLDACLPFPEPYSIPDATAEQVMQTRRSGGRVVAIGTTVVRALESAAQADCVVRPGSAFAELVISATTELRVVDAVLSGTHELATSHYRLLEAFAERKALERGTREMDSLAMRTHEFGDSCFVTATRGARRPRLLPPEIPSKESKPPQDRRPSGPSRFGNALPGATR